ncbi:MarR family winged helix-turn-helix transcriptional regulator [Dongia deserti]|uniref:MarR family winged helix-turn-helix transcriptional regulator n=1 Tax=Dongia deserti TaxID=2268030 RepID=UPI0025473E9A|nr:MarR family transcriptional regulator [Dongia deserti]
MKPGELRDLNIIGAFALALADDFKAAMEDLAEGNESACAALIVIGQESGLSVDRLSKILRLSQPGTVRLVDRLAAAKLVERKTGTDRRAVALRLTDSGRRQVKSLFIGRQHALGQALRGLDDWERSTLAAIATKVLRGLDHSQVESDRRCRLCDDESCPDETCPMVVV